MLSEGRRLSGGANYDATKEPNANDREAASEARPELPHPLHVASAPTWLTEQSNGSGRQGNDLAGFNKLSIDCNQLGSLKRDAKSFRVGGLP